LCAWPQSWKNLFSRINLPMFIMSTSLAAFQQLTGINAIIFYGARVQYKRAVLVPWPSHAWRALGLTLVIPTSSAQRPSCLTP
jgi:hypothetical protein